ncbi:MAG TPA: HAD-IB family phosphatase [Myxococcota bacterium]|nr:HAD-IB family phosphatase [Myxococcota bacterium]
MFRPVVLVERPGAGRLEPVRLGARVTDTRATPDRGASTLLRAEGVPAAGRHRAGSIEIDLAVHDVEGAAIVDAVVRNTEARPVRVDALVLGFRWTGHGARSFRWLRHGWQSWSVTEARPLDDQGEPPPACGPWLRGMFHALGESPQDRAGWHRSELVSVIGASPTGIACLAGVYERGETLGIVYARPGPPDAAGSRDVALEVELRLEVPLQPGEARRTEAVRLALGDDPSQLLEEYAEAYGRAAGARTRAPFQSGWCSWYHFFHGVTEDDLRRNLDALVRSRAELPIEVFQLDDGYQRAIGDWLETNAKFPRGIAPLAAEIQDAGFRPGLWTAPFCVAPDSYLFESHRDWLLQQGSEIFRGLHHAMWTKDGWIHVLDASRPEVVEHLERTFRALVEMGWTYQKLDFLYTQAMQADAFDVGVTRAQRLRRGLAAVRQGCGSETFLLGCGCPLGPAVGVVDGMRIGPDVAPVWQVDPSRTLPGLAGTHPSTRNGVRNTLARAFMHRRLWLNDPDCLMVRETDTQLTRAESQTLAAAIVATGGMVIFSDDVPMLDAKARALVRDVLALSREVDAGVARVLDPLAAELAPAAVARCGERALIALMNGDDKPRVCSLDLRRLGFPVCTEPLVRVLGAADLSLRPPARLEAALGPHESVLVRLPTAPALAVFCDFDGTFAVQDVGSTLAKRHAAERRPAQLARLARGEITAWEYNLEILDRLPLSKAATDDFLETIELDPGAKPLLAFCDAHGLPFRILSDGFDYNLDRLRERHGVRFAYDANRLRFENDTWRIEASLRNPNCGCGTGNCKRARIDAYRAGHPGSRIVHIGNGRVSDLCGALAADIAFAKGSLAEALAENKAPFERFETLHDVVASLEAQLARR